MTYEYGKSAMNLEIPPRVPRTEYSAHRHWALVNKVTGSNIEAETEDEKKLEASQKFVKSWNYDFMWSTLVDREYMKGRKTDMGHGEYAAGGVDKREAKESPFKNLHEIYEFDPVEEYGKISISKMKKKFEEHYQKNREFWPNCVNCSGIYITMFSGLIEVFGWENLLRALGNEPETFGQVTRRWEDWISQFFEAYAEADIPLMMVHDDICSSNGPITDPDWYREYIFPAYKRLWRPVIDSGTKILFTSDGNYTEFVDDIAEAGAHGFVLEPVTDMKYIAENYGDSHVFIGNADTRIIKSGTKNEIRKEVERCMEIGKKWPGFFMAVGNHIPPDTAVEKALYYNRVYEELAKR